MKQIATKLTKIMQACSYVQKTGYNKFHGYKYATAADVLEKANEAMAENNVACQVIPKLIEFRDVTTAKGAIEHLATIEATVNLIDNESGETLALVGIGSGQDAGDKAVMKAQTAAIKYAWMMSLNISTGDDPEADEKTDLSGEKNQAQPSTPASQNKAATAKSGAKSGQNKLVFKAKIDGKYQMLPIDQTPLDQLEWYAANSKSDEHKAAAAEYLEKLKDQANESAS